MNAAEKTELALIPVAGGSTWLAAATLPEQIGLGKLLLCASALLLFQGLLRDLWLVARARRTPPANPPRVARCMCAESIVGVTGIVAGILLLSLGLGRPVPMGRSGWTGFVVLVLAVGFAIKDYVLEANPWRLRRDKDHLNIIVRWRR